MDALKRAIEDEKSCDDVTHLVISICASCDSIRNRMIKHYMKKIANKGKDGMSTEEWNAIQALIRR
ncbi:MAG: hypothetical protein KAS32_06430 [Candidatus Peribacteraceae bacterium]|nr:hypothetical protein [Candidatus Peribacteraceae bacterium]